MRIIWSETESVFVAEFSSDFAGDLDAVKQAGFRTFGAPEWLWYAPPPGVAALSRLQKNRPKSGLVITEVAFQKYNLLKEQFDKKVEFKKTFKKLQHVADQDSVKRPTYKDENGIVSFVVEPVDEEFTWKFSPPALPDQWCFVCGDPVYDYEGTDLCLWCAEKF